MLFWCSVSRAVLRSPVVARLSMLRKRSMADVLRWMLCFGMSSLETKVKQPRSSQLKSMGQQSRPAATTLFSKTKRALRRGRNSVFRVETCTLFEASATDTVLSWLTPGQAAPAGGEADPVHPAATATATATKL